VCLALACAPALPAASLGGSGEPLRERLLNLERAIQGDPENLPLAASYRALAIEAAQFDRSIDFFEKIAKRRGSGPNVYISLALAYVDKVPPAGDIRRLFLGRDAMGALTKSIEQRPCALAYYLRGVINGIYDTEGIRTAHKKFGNKPLIGEQVRWGLENLDITPARITELGAEGLFAPMKISCANHAGNGLVRISQWDGQKWKYASDWITPNHDMLDPMYKESALAYAKEKNITPRDCGKPES